MGKNGSELPSNVKDALVTDKVREQAIDVIVANACAAGMVGD